MGNRAKAVVTSSSSKLARSDRRILAGLLYLLATIQVALDYQLRVPPYLQIGAYERGAAPMPFQGRVLMMLLFRWVHGNKPLVQISGLVSGFTPIFGSQIHVTPESLLQLFVNIGGLILAGLVATRIYQASSRHRLLTPYIYALVLVMCVSTYVLQPVKTLRFVYDLPSLGLFSIGLYLIYFRKHPLLFVFLFMVATVNRETTLFLLLFFLLASLLDDNRIVWKNIYAPRTLQVMLPLALYWMGWHIFVGRIYAHNPRQFLHYYLINAGLLVWPAVWPQLFGAGCYLVAVILLFRRSVTDKVLRIWLWVLPAWFLVMFYYGIIVENRIFGELVPYFACLTALIAEQAILCRIGEDAPRAEDTVLPSWDQRSVPAEAKCVGAGVDAR